jgi:hypothetical protein
VNCDRHLFTVRFIHQPRQDGGQSKEYSRSAVNDVGPSTDNKVSRVGVCLLSLKKTVNNSKRSGRPRQKSMSNINITKEQEEEKKEVASMESEVVLFLTVYGSFVVREAETECLRPHNKLQLGVRNPVRQQHHLEPNPNFSFRANKKRYNPWSSSTSSWLVKASNLHTAS